MRILFDQGTPVPLRRFIAGHEIETAWQRGWAQLSNGDLLAAAETAGFDLLVTTDQNLRYQQNLSARRIAILVLTVANWPAIEPTHTLLPPRFKRFCPAATSSGPRRERDTHAVGAHTARAMRDIVRLLRARVSAHSHTRTTRQPALRNARVTSRSRAALRASLAFQNARRVFGFAA